MSILHLESKELTWYFEEDTDKEWGTIERQYSKTDQIIVIVQNVVGYYQLEKIKWGS